MCNPYSISFDPLSLLQAIKLGRQMKSLFSNGISAVQAQSTADWLLDQGFSRQADSSMLSLHVVDVDANAQYTLAMEIHDGCVVFVQPRYVRYKFTSNICCHLGMNPRRGRI